MRDQTVCRARHQARVFPRIASNRIIAMTHLVWSGKATPEVDKGAGMINTMDQFFVTLKRRERGKTA